LTRSEEQANQHNNCVHPIAEKRLRVTQMLERIIIERTKEKE